MITQPAAPSRSQRWRDRRGTFVPSASVIDPKDYAVDVISSEKVAAPFLAAHHYIGTLPLRLLSCGLYRNGRGGHSELVGVATFSQPVNNASIPLRTGLAGHNQACDLGRLVLVDDVPGNGETWFVSRAFKLLRAERPEIESVIAYSDPMLRRGADGKMVLPGHVGHVYACLGATSTGRTQPRKRFVMPNGAILSDRAISKISNGETGEEYAIGQAVAGGCPTPEKGEKGSAYIARLKKEKWLSPEHHPGCHAYTFALTRKARKAMSGVPISPAPKRDYSVQEGDVTLLPLFAS